MTRYAALLRGVNVGGVTVTSTELALVFRDLGFTQVKTVLASGNVLFESAAGDTRAQQAALKASIEKALGERFGYDAWIVLIEHDALTGIIDGFPYAEVDHRQPYVVFCSEPAVREEVLAFAGGLAPDADIPERAGAGPAVVYWEVPKGSSTDTALAKFLAKPRFKATTTTRNLRTLRKLL